MRKFTALFAAAFAVVAVSACSGASSSTALSAAPVESTSSEAVSAAPENKEITITHGLGETTLTTNPKKVVVLDYGLLDALSTAGVESIVAVPKASTLPGHLQQFATESYINAGSLSQADFEAIYTAGPDLILISNRMSKAYEELSKIAPTVYLSMPTGSYLETFEGNLDTLAEIFPAQAEALTSAKAGIAATVEEIKALSAGHTALVVQANDGELSSFGYGSRYALVYTDLGFILTDESIEESTHGQAASFEYVAQQNPEYLFVIDRSAAVASGSSTGAEQLLSNELIAGMDAAKNNKIFYLNSTNWYTVSGGIQSTTAMLDEIKAALA